MIRKYIEYSYLLYNLIIGSIYLLWIFLLYYYNCKCSKHILEKIIHIYWYVIFVLDILIFFRLFSLDEIHLIVIGNILGLVNIYLTYRYIKILDEKQCECSNMLIKDLIIIIYICVGIFIVSFFIALIISYMSYGKIHLFKRLKKNYIKE
jgi:hypothetical protein